MRAPHFWSAGLDPYSREAAPVTRALLTPLAALYGLGVKRKIARARPAHVDIPVVCIGNLTVGGVGKTPLVVAIRDRFAAAGLRAASLSRGYGGRLKGPLRVEPGTHAASDVGDEPLMLAGTGEAWIGANRPDAARAMQAAGVEVIIMDDGHQNPSLTKTLSLVAVDAGAPFGNGHVLPKGPLREPVAFGLSRADVVILLGEAPVPAAVEKSGRPVLRARIRPTGAVPDGPLVAFAGIGHPEKLFDSLTESGADLREGVGYDDHYMYTSGDLDFLRKLAADHGARLITTEKDVARLPADWRVNVLTWPVKVAFEEDTALDALLRPLIKRAG